MFLRRGIEQEMSARIQTEQHDRALVFAAYEQPPQPVGGTLRPRRVGRLLLNDHYQSRAHGQTRFDCLDSFRFQIRSSYASKMMHKIKVINFIILGRVLHPDQNRVVSVRECARSQVRFDLKIADRVGVE